MNLNADICYRALAAHDARFDGLFYVGVTTTGIYCRPVCTARTPGRTRCQFYSSAAAAEREGFRPCLRCRPELAPGNAPVDAGGRIAHAAAAKIAAGALNDGRTLEDLAATFRISARQLRRIVQQELGVSPVELAQTHRLLLAKQLLTETALPMIDVARAAGFGSVRRYNHLFRQHYQLTPCDLRKGRKGRSGAESAAGDMVRLTLMVRPPFAWSTLLAFLRARTLAGVESVTDGRYSRTVRIGDVRGWLTVGPHPTRANTLQLDVAASLVPVLPQVRAGVRQLLDLDARPDVIDAHLATDPRLKQLVKRRPGLRVAGAFDGFELALRVIIGQQVSVSAARTVAGRLVATLGEPMPETAVASDTLPAGLTHFTPTPAEVAATSVNTLASLGMPGKRAETIRALAAALADRQVFLDPGDDVDVVIEELRALPGVGEWTATCIAMRALHWPDAFPHGDLGVRKALGLTSAKELTAAAEAWRPWRAYAVMHLWQSFADES